MDIKNLKKNKKGEFLARHWFVVLILFGVFIALGGLMVSDMADNYNEPDIEDESFADNYDTVSSTNEDITQMRESVEGKSGRQTISPYITMFKSTFTAIDVVMSSFSNANAVTKNMAQDMGIPPEVANIIFPAIITIIIGLIIFVIISAVSRGRF